MGSDTGTSSNVPSAMQMSHPILQSHRWCLFPILRLCCRCCLRLTCILWHSPFSCMTKSSAFNVSTCNSLPQGFLLLSDSSVLTAGTGLKCPGINLLPTCFWKQLSEIATLQVIRRPELEGWLSENRREPCNGLEMKDCSTMGREVNGLVTWLEGNNTREAEMAHDNTPG